MGFPFYSQSGSRFFSLLFDLVLSLTKLVYKQKISLVLKLDYFVKTVKKISLGGFVFFP